MIKTEKLPASLVSPQKHSMGTVDSPVDFVLSLDADSKHAVFIALMRESVELNGRNGLLPVDDESGAPFGYYVSSKAAAEQVQRLVPAQSESDLQRTRGALARLEDTFEIDRFLNGSE